MEDPSKTDHIFQNDRGDFSKRQTHLNGLQHMIALRGGVNAVKSSSPTCDRMIRW